MSQRPELARATVTGRYAQLVRWCLDAESAARMACIHLCTDDDARARRAAGDLFEIARHLRRELRRAGRCQEGGDAGR